MKIDEAIINQEQLCFNIIYIPGMTTYLAPFVSSLLESTSCRFRLIANGCSKSEASEIERFCKENSRLEYYVIASNKMITHCKALSVLQKIEKSDYFCFMDADIFASGPFLDEMLSHLAFNKAVFSGYPIWCASEYKTILDDWPDMAGRHIFNSDGKCLGGSFFAIYDNNALNYFIESTGISFERYNWKKIPKKYQFQLTTLGLNKQTYDTGKVLNILFQEYGNRLKFVESETLFHLGALRLLTSPQLGKSLRKKLKNIVSTFKQMLKQIIGIDPPSLTNKQETEYEKILQTREWVTDHFSELLTSLNNGFDYDKKVDLPNIEIQKKVNIASDEMKLIWRDRA